MISGEDNTAVGRWWVEAYNERDAWAEVAVRAPGLLDAGTWTAPSPPSAFAALWLTVEEGLADGDEGSIRLTFRGTDRGEFRASRRPGGG